VRGEGRGTKHTLQDATKVGEHLLANLLVPNEFRQRNCGLNTDGKVGVGDAVDEGVEGVLESLRKLPGSASIFGKKEKGKKDAPLAKPRSCRMTRTSRRARTLGSGGSHEET
jgi:hypothetical protein